MRKQSSLIQIITISVFAALAMFGAGIASAQDSKPTPSRAKPIRTEKLEGVPVIAADFASGERSLPDLGRVGVDMMSQRPIALREAIVKALENNKDIEVSRKDVEIAEFDYKASNGFFTPRLTGTSFLERSTAPNVSIFSNSTTTTTTSFVADIGYQGFVKRFGTVYNAEFENKRLSSDNPLSILSPQYDSSFKFSVVQPLFKGRKSDDARRNIEIAKRNLSLTDRQFRQKAMETTVAVQRSYWNLTFTLRNLQVQRDGVRDAKKQLAHSERLVKEGLLAPVDVIAAETQVANLEQSVYLALEQVNRAENQLKNLIAQNRQDPLWGASLVPTDSVTLKAPKISLAAALELALENRIEFGILDVAREINEYDKRFYKQQLEPEINLTASFKSSGVAGRPNSDILTIFSNTSSTDKINEIIGRVNLLDPASPPIARLPIRPQQSVPDIFTGNYQGALADVFSNRYPTYRIGITFIFSPDGSAQEALLGKSLVQGEKLRVLREQLEQAIQVDVRNALQAIRTAQARLRSAAISRENSEKEYESEKRKLDAGMSDIYKVLRRQTALVSARSAELLAQTELNKSITELQRATGNSLEANNVETKLKK